MRTHPIEKTQKMHYGTDLTAKAGTSINHLPQEKLQK